MPKRLKKIAERAAAALGCALIPEWRLQTYPQARYLRRLFALLSIDCVFDVGANVGQYRDFLRDHVGYQGWIVSFEPIPASAKLLRERATRDPRWRIEECALGPEAGEQPFNIMQSTVFSSFLPPKEQALSEFKRHNTVAQRVMVKVRTLREELPRLRQELGFVAPYLKLDTQGFDLEVLRGGGDRLQDFKALQTEASVQPLYEGMPSYQAAIDWLTDAGFMLSGMYPVNEAAFPLLVEFDCHMVRRDVASRH